MSRDELDELSRRLFESVESERPSEALRARVLAAVRVRRALSASEQPSAALPETPAPTPVKQRSRLLSTRWLLAAAALAALPLAWWGRRYPTPHAPSIAAEAHSRRGAVSAAPRTGGGPSPSEPAAALEPLRATRSDAQPNSELRPRALAPARSVQSSDVAPKPPPRGLSQRPAEQASRSSPAPSNSASSPTPSATPARSDPAPKATLAEELSWLKAARARLRAGDSQGALGLLDAYTNELNGSDLRDEASVLRIEALSTSGRSAEAVELAKRFIAENPNSPLVERARSFLARSAEHSSPGPKPLVP